MLSPISFVQSYLGRRFEYSDKEFLEILDMIDKSVAQLAKIFLLSRLPWVEHWPGDPGWSKLYFFKGYLMGEPCLIRENLISNVN